MGGAHKHDGQRLFREKTGERRGSGANKQPPDTKGAAVIGECMRQTGIHERHLVSTRRAHCFESRLLHSRADRWRARVRTYAVNTGHSPSFMRLPWSFYKRHIRHATRGLVYANAQLSKLQALELIFSFT